MKRLLQNLFKSKAKRVKRQKATRPLGIESLEERRVFASAVMYNGTLFVHGLDVAETISVTQFNNEISVSGTPISVSGVPQPRIAASQVSAITIWGNGGRDTIRLDSESMGGEPITIPATIYGGDDNDKITGGWGVDRIFGQLGEDKLYGNEAPDFLDGGLGRDTLYGERGSDKLFGDEGNDKLYGGDGFDQLLGGRDQDWLSGGNGDDILEGGPGRDNLHGQRGNDSYVDNDPRTRIGERGSRREFSYFDEFGWIDAELADSGLRTEVRVVFQDGNEFGSDFGRRDMLNIFSTVQRDGVSAAELTDLRTLAAESSAGMLNMPEHVRVLTYHVVNRDPANYTYQQTPLGNLQPGSNSETLNKLVNKWFHGGDHPVAGGTYREAQGSLFVNGPSFLDIKQGEVGDCYFLATLAETADRDPAAIERMVIDNGDGTFTVRFFFQDAFGELAADYVTVDKWLPVNSQGNFLYANYGRAASNSGNELWVALVEKAFAQWNETGRSGQDGTNSYNGNGTQVPDPDRPGQTCPSDGINAGLAGRALTQVTGLRADANLFRDTSEFLFQTAYRQGRLVVLTTWSEGRVADPEKFTPGHEFALTGFFFDSSRGQYEYHLWNPHGHQIKASWQELVTNFIMWDNTYHSDYDRLVTVVALRGRNGAFLQSDVSGGAGLRFQGSGTSAFEQFQMIQLGNNQVAFKAKNGLYLRAEGGGGGAVNANSPWIGGWETFTMTRLYGNKVSFQAQNGQFLSFDEFNGGGLLATGALTTPWETFELVKKS